MSSRAYATAIAYPSNGNHQAVSFTASSARTAAGMGDQCRLVSLVSTADCHIAFGPSNVDATTNDFFLLANTMVMFPIRPGEFVAAIRSSADGILHVSEMDH